MEDNFFMDWDEGNGFRMIQVKRIKFAMHFISIFITSSPHSLSEIDFPHSNICLTQNNQQWKENNFSPCSFPSFCKERKPSKAAPTHDRSLVPSAGT